MAEEQFFVSVGSSRVPRAVFRSPHAASFVTLYLAGLRAEKASGAAPYKSGGGHFPRIMAVVSAEVTAVPEQSLELCGGPVNARRIEHVYPL